MRTIKIATRKSALALWQAYDVQAKLRALHSDLNVELVPMVSKGDKILDVALSKVGGKGLFVKELEHALLNHEADIAVHSMKDVPMEFPEGLMLGPILEREDPRDAFVSNTYANLDALPQGACVGTSSLRRQSQLLAIRPDLNIAFLRGNVNTRLAKLDNGDFDAIILAAAGLIRLEFEDRIRDYIAPEVILPAGGQGAVGIELRSNDPEIDALIAPLNNTLTAQRIHAERAMNHTLEGGCQVPIGGFAVHQNNQLWLRGLVASADGKQTIKVDKTGPSDNAVQLGHDVAQALLDKGAGEILKAVYANA